MYLGTWRAWVMRAPGVPKDEKIQDGMVAWWHGDGT